MTTLTFNCVSIMGEELREFQISDVIIAGWTGRDRHAVEAHIVELEELGVKRPATVPCYYFVTDDRLTQDENIQVLGEESSGEIEFFLLNDGERLWVGIGSDHTDRKVEAYDITVSKQICSKPVGRTLWPLDEVREHWDQLEMRSWREDAGSAVLYQQGKVTTMLEPEALLERYATTCAATFEPGTVMFCGTLAAIGGIQYTSRLTLELNDPQLKRSIRFSYQMQSI
ncbi:DUF2848 domain-containing protein [Pseudomonas sp. REP124]|uniref:DUF2848 domain-containing protein n=1 Tax=Pseudomonas sp. REP124 TaxID=2875731 RepID=UPI001CC9D5AA|nr:DUF2848 domain-containing protein [Pseudomonas sp. REP124]MBZ9784998.1 DUF2848 domain-containing protein [Pseudomonas sp. REP124]